jgi:hypothetical protein
MQMTSKYFLRGTTQTNAQAKKLLQRQAHAAGARVSSLTVAEAAIQR